MDFAFLALCIFYFVVIFLVLSIVHNQYDVYQKLKNIPQIDRYPFGVMFELMNLSNYACTKKLLTHLEKMNKEGIYVLWIFGQPYINVFKPEYLELILPSTVNITKGTHYKLLEPWLGNGLITSTGKQWFHDRKLIWPTFHFSILNQFAVILSEKAEILTTCLERKIEKNPGKAIDICPFIFNAALDIICGKRCKLRDKDITKNINYVAETAMGVDIRAQEVVTKYTSAVHTISWLIMTRIFRPWYWINWLFYLSPRGKQYKSTLDTLHEFTKQVICKRKAERKLQNDYSEPKNEDNEFNIGKRKRKAFLDLLLDQNAKDDCPLTDDELRAQVDTFMFAGQDTTAIAIIWTLFLLGNNLEHQEKVHKELEEVFGVSETPASVKELSQLKYLDRVMKETLRILPSIPVITRKLTEDVKLGNNILPKGLTIGMSIIFIHRNPEIWPDPLKFDPDRFLPENSKHRHPYAFIPFSAGPRNCIGQKFALIEQKILLTAVLRKWRVKSVKTIDTIKYGGAILLRPREEVLIHFTPKK